jgi:macrolide-specific efflux system membrane fusion protein
LKEIVNYPQRIIAMSKRIKGKYFLPPILAAGLIALLFYLFAPGQKITYLTETVRRGNIVQTVNATGDIAALQLVSVGAQVSGQILKLHVQLGQQLNKGDIVAEIDSTTQLNELNTGKAKLRTYQAQLQARQITLRVARKQYEREKSLYAREATSRENLENAEDAYAAAQAAVDEMQSLIQQTSIAVNTAEVNLGYTRISAPLAGTVVAVHVEEGQTVNANQTTPTIVQIADLGMMEIKIQISEADVTKVRPGMKVEYSILGEPGQIFTTVLQAVDPGLTSLTDKKYQENTASESAVYYYGKLTAPNPEGKLRIGMTVQSAITIAAVENVLMAPSIAIQQRHGLHFVRLMNDNGIPVEREVETGLSDNINTEIKSGLQAGDVVVSAQMATEEMGAVNTRMRSPRL